MSFRREQLGERLQTGAGELGLALDERMTNQLLDFLELLQHWNRYYNLTGVDDPDAMIATHVLDSLALKPHLGGEPVIDVGTGGGLPGLVLAVVDRDRQYVLLDRTAKKIRFLHHAVGTLGLDRVTAVQTRAEDYRPSTAPGTVVARAFAAIPRALAVMRGFIDSGTRILLPKGRYPAAELEGLPPGFRIERVEPLTIPTLGAARHLVIAAYGGDRPTESGR